MGVQVLDCTLRDGGYVNNWEFGRRAIASILDKLEAGGIDIIECGFLTSRPRGEDCSLFRSPGDIAPLLPQRPRRAMFVAMIAMWSGSFRRTSCRPGGRGTSTASASPSTGRRRTGPFPGPAP